MASKKTVQATPAAEVVKVQHYVNYVEGEQIKSKKYEADLTQGEFDMLSANLKVLCSEENFDKFSDDIENDSKVVQTKTGKSIGLLVAVNGRVIFETKPDFKLYETIEKIKDRYSPAMKSKAKIGDLITVKMEKGRVTVKIKDADEVALKTLTPEAQAYVLQFLATKAQIASDAKKAKKDAEATPVLDEVPAELADL